MRIKIIYIGHIINEQLKIYLYSVKILMVYLLFGKYIPQSIIKLFTLIIDKLKIFMIGNVLR